MILESKGMVEIYSILQMFFNAQQFTGTLRKVLTKFEGSGCPMSWATDENVKLLVWTV